MVKDIYNAVARYAQRKRQLSEDKSENAKLFSAWLDKKETSLLNRKGRDGVARIRCCKTLNKYIALFRTLDRIVKKPFKKLTAKDMQRLYEDIETGVIKSEHGKTYSASTRHDLYNKFFKSDFFKFIGLYDVAKTIFTLEKKDDREVRFFLFEDFERMTKYTPKLRNKLFLYFLLDTGMRVGTALNITRRDIEKKYNAETKQEYYVVHIQADYTKSKRADTLALLIPTTNELMTLFLQENELKPSQRLFDFSHANARKIVDVVSHKAKIKTLPDKKNVTLHDFRRSCATYMLKKGYSIDVIKKRLGHKPSSTVIDRYVSYLSLGENETVAKAQSLSHDELNVKYKASQEQINVLSNNMKLVNEHSDVMQVSLTDMREQIREQAENSRKILKHSHDMYCELEGLKRKMSKGKTQVKK